MKPEKKQEREAEKKAARKGIAGDAMEAEKKKARNGIAEAESHAGGEGATAMKSQDPAEGDKAEAGNGKGKRRVSQEHIDMLLMQKATCTGAYRVSRTKEYIEKHYKGPRRESFLSQVARLDAAMEKVRAEDARILEQYERFGCAYNDVQEVDASVIEEKLRAYSRYLPRWPPAA